MSEWIIYYIIGITIIAIFVLETGVKTIEMNLKTNHFIIF